MQTFSTLRFFLRASLSLILTLVLSLQSTRARASDPVKAEPGLPEYFGTSFQDVARTVLDSTSICEGVIHVDPGSPSKSDPSRTVSAEIAIGKLLCGDGDRLPASLAFKRSVSESTLQFGESMFTAPFHGWSDAPMDEVKIIAFLKLQDGQWDLIKAVPEKSDEGALLVSELAQLKTSGIRKDNPQALTQALDPKTHPLAEAVRVRILNMEAQK